MQLLHDQQQNKILKHVSTRWLSIGKYLPPLLDNWSALYNFFKAQESAASGTIEKEKTGKLSKIYSSSTNKLYCLFLCDFIKVFETINTELQSDKP